MRLYKDTHYSTLTNNEPIMSKQVFISMLRQGNTAAEILSILDAIVSDNVTDGNDSEVATYAMPTFEEIDF